MTIGDVTHESRHAERVLERIRERMAAAGGWLPFDDYMRLALYEPGLGYYSAGAQKLGAGGGFHHCAGDLAVVRALPRTALR